MIPAGQALTVRCQFCQTWNRVDGARAAERPKCGNCARFILLDRPWTLFQDSFQRTIAESELPILVDFYADWCGPCRYQAPILKQVADEVGDSARIIKVDVDKNPAAAQQFGVRGIPALIIFRKGQIVWRASGVRQAAELVQQLRTAAA
jgi:thioredoxin